MTKTLKARPEIEFVSYDGEYPTLCSGTLTIRVNGKLYFLKDILHSGGNIVRMSDGDYDTELGEWDIWTDNLPPELKKYSEDIKLLVNMNVKHGCCGGCI